MTKPDPRTTSLTRRRAKDSDSLWHVYCGDILAGTISKRISAPSGADSWEWGCGFYPGSQPGDQKVGTAPTFEKAREKFLAAWTIFLAQRTDEDILEYRRYRAWQKEKERRFARGEPMDPHWKPDF